MLVIEGGPVLDGDAETEIVVPGWINRTGRTYTWNVTTLPNKELNNRISQVTAARIAGGGSALNYMFFDRGSKRDYDEWAIYTGDSGWGWDSMIKYFRKAETFHPPSPEAAEKYGITWDPSAHGTDGPVQVTFPDYLWESTSKFCWFGVKDGC